MFGQKNTTAAAPDAQNPAEAAQDTPAAETGAEGNTAPASREAELENELAQVKDQALRALAEAENTRRRLEREMEEAKKYAVSGFARELLAVADNLKRAISAVTPEQREQNAELKNMLIGIEATERQLMAAFEKYQVKPVDSMGKVFDPNFHQVMFEIESAEHPAGTILQELQSGYAIEGRLLRPALVGTAKAPAAGSDGKVDTQA